MAQILQDPQCNDILLDIGMPVIHRKYVALPNQHFRSDNYRDHTVLNLTSLTA